MPGLRQLPPASYCWATPEAAGSFATASCHDCVIPAGRVVCLVALSRRAVADCARIGGPTVADAKALGQLVGGRRRGCGIVLLVQALVLELYAAHTAYTHELPWPLPDMLAGVATLLGIDATADGSNIVMHSMRQVHRLGATWELLLDPATLLFFVGGLTMLACSASRDHGRSE